MNDLVRNTNDSRVLLSDRLDEIQMSAYERHIARAHLARAEAMAELLGAAWSGLARLYRGLTTRAPRHPAPSAS